MAVATTDPPSGFANYVTGDGIWEQILNRTPGPVRRGALFLDRDGVVVEEVPYLHRVEDARLVPGTIDAVRLANARQIPVILITNQGGIGLGKYDWSDFARLQDWIYGEFAGQDALLNGIFACPFHPKGQDAFLHTDHPDRKPNPGMLFRAAELFPIDLGRSWFVGDRDVDVLAARAAGLAGAVIVASEHNLSATNRRNAPTLASEAFTVIDCDDRAALGQALAPLWAGN